ncbi:hypothetical protein D3C80_1627180 [compost metagenome]
MKHHNAITTSDRPPSTRNSMRQSQAVMIQPDSGAVRIPAIGTNMITIALARPRSLSGNQLLIMVSTTGSIPPSETPKAKRRNSSWY